RGPPRRLRTGGTRAHRRRRARHRGHRRRHGPPRRAAGWRRRRPRACHRAGVPRRPPEAGRPRRPVPDQLRLSRHVATVDRVLPWRRQPASDELAPLLATYRARHPRAPTTLISQAYDVAAAAHENQLRKSGDPYIHHPLAVAMILAELGLDDVTVAAALLHDAVEDTGLTFVGICRNCGPEGATIVVGGTKNNRV